MAGPTSPLTRQRDLAEHFRVQAGHCRNLGSPFTARVLDLLASDIEAGGVLHHALEDFDLPPGASAVALRVAGALHALVRSGRAPALAAVYPPEPMQAVDDAALGALLSQALADAPELLADYLHRAVQTNEVQRSAVLLPGLLEIARRTTLPLTLLEIGASGGLNLLADHYGYDFGPARWQQGTPRVQIAPDWRGDPPPVDAPLQIAVRHGVDLHPLDLHDDAVVERGLSYIWADQPQRLDRFRAAVAVLREQGLQLDAADAATWLPQRLAEREPHGCTVVMHSIMWQYMPPEARERIEAAIRDAGAAATPEAPVAWLRFEPIGDNSAFELSLDLWPEPGARRRLALTHPHGAWVQWLD